MNNSRFLQCKIDAMKLLDNLRICIIDFGATSTKAKRAKKLWIICASEFSHPNQAT